MGGQSTSAPAAIQDGLYLWVFVLGTDGKMYANRGSLCSSTVTGWFSLGNRILTSAPAVGMFDANIELSHSVHVFARGTDNAIWNIWITGATSSWPYDALWSDWQSLGGSWTSKPAAATYRIGRSTGGVDTGVWIFARGNDGKLYVKTQKSQVQNGAWGDWMPLGGTLLGGPGAGGFDLNYIRVYARSSADNKMYYTQSLAAINPNFGPWTLAP